MVASYVQLLERRYRDQLDEEAEEYIDYAVEGATRMQSLIRDLLAYAQVGGEAHGREVVDMDMVVDRALERLEDRIEATDAEIERGELTTVLGNPTELVQVVEALVSNGIKFQPEAATPHVRIAAKPVGDEPAWHFTVEDDGLGIESAYHDRIFVLFQRLQPRTEFEGTGIGLALCKKVVENLGGRIWVDSAPGEGSTFHFTLPSEEAEGEEFEAPHDPPGQDPWDPS